MLDLESFLIPLQSQKALIISDSDWGIEELEGLLTTLGGVAAEKMKIVLRKIDPRSYVGAGKLDELARILEARELDLLLVDFDLSPSQMKNIEAVTKKLVLDRSGIILEIFSRHAQTKESKLQVELARLQYLMPRLTNLWSHFERQRGSGGASLKGKGMGEKQFEVDRRLVKERIYALQDRLRQIEDARELHRRGREQLLKVALVGYTNAGKSTLLNQLTHSKVLVEDALFATLDASVRLMNPKLRPAVLAIDTVGFIDRLPHGLVASFRSTLSAVLEADLLLHVMDCSHPEVKRHFEVTMEVLKELGADTLPMFLVFNKSDRAKDTSLVKIWASAVVRERGLAPPIFVSALNLKDVDALREKVMLYFEKTMEAFDVLIPFEDGKSLSKMHEIGRILTQKETEKGMFVRILTRPEFLKQANLERFKV